MAELDFVERLSFGMLFPSSSGSANIVKTMGMLDVAALAATVEGASPIGTMTEIFRLTNSAANAGRRS